MKRWEREHRFFIFCLDKCCTRCLFTSFSFSFPEFPLFNCSSLSCFLLCNVLPSLQIRCLCWILLWTCAFSIMSEEKSQSYRWVWTCKPLQNGTLTTSYKDFLTKSQSTHNNFLHYFCAQLSASLSHHALEKRLCTIMPNLGAYDILFTAVFLSV